MNKSALLLGSNHKATCGRWCAITHCSCGAAALHGLKTCMRTECIQRHITGATR
jgi:hypothetical protein